MAKTVIKKEKPRIFVGSSTEGLPIAEAIQLLLEHDAEVTVWTQGVFEASSNSLDDLIEILDKVDFGVFVFSPDDISKIRQKRHFVARDNVIFEMGLFVGRLGKKRTLYIVPRERANFHLPSDLIGVTPLDYDSNRSDGRIQAALGSVSTKIKERTKQLGRFETNVPIVEHRVNQEPSVFTRQEESEFEHIYAKLKPIGKASMEVVKKNPDQMYIRIKIGKCIFNYSLIKVIWANINEGNNKFNDFLSQHQDEAEKIVTSKSFSFLSDIFSYYQLKPESNLIPLLSMLGLLDEQLDNDPRQMSPNFAFHIYSKKMYRFYNWIDYNNLGNDEPLLELTDFVENKD